MKTKQVEPHCQYQDTSMKEINVSIRILNDNLFLYHHYQPSWIDDNDYDIMVYQSSSFLTILHFYILVYKAELASEYGCPRLLRHADATLLDTA